MAAKTIDLGEFEGQAIAGTTIALRGAGDGLSQAMKVDPVILHHGQEVYIVYRARVVDVQHPEIKDSNEVTRKHILMAGTATLIDGTVVRKALDDQATRIQAQRDAETGAMALDLSADPLDPDGGEKEPYEPVTAAGARKAGRATKKVAKPAKKATGARKGARKSTAKKAGGHLAAVPDAPVATPDAGADATS